MNRKHYVTWTKTLLTKYDLFKAIIWIGWLSLQEQPNTHLINKADDRQKK